MGLIFRPGFMKPHIGSSFPVIVTSNAFTENTARDNPWVYSLPAGVASGDLVLLFITTEASAGAVTITAPAGWSTLYNDASSNGTLRAQACFWIVASGSLTTVSVGFNRTVNTAGVSLRITGADTANMAAGVNTSGNTTIPDPPSLTASWGAANNLWLASAHWLDIGTATAPSTYTTVNTANSNSTANTSCSVASLTSTNATENPGTFTITSARWNANTVAIKGL